MNETERDALNTRGSLLAEMREQIRNELTTMHELCKKQLKTKNSELIALKQQEINLEKRIKELERNILELTEKNTRLSEEKENSIEELRLAIQSETQRKMRQALLEQMKPVVKKEIIQSIREEVTTELKATVEKELEFELRQKLSLEYDEKVKLELIKREKLIEARIRMNEQQRLQEKVKKEMLTFQKKYEEQMREQYKELQVEEAKQIFIESQNLIKEEKAELARMRSVEALRRSKQEQIFADFKKKLEEKEAELEKREKVISDKEKKNQQSSFRKLSEITDELETVRLEHFKLKSKYSIACDELSSLRSLLSTADPSVFQQSQKGGSLREGSDSRKTKHSAASLSSYTPIRNNKLSSNCSIDLNHLHTLSGTKLRRNKERSFQSHENEIKRKKKTGPIVSEKEEPFKESDLFLSVKDLIKSVREELGRIELSDEQDKGQ